MLFFTSLLKKLQSALTVPSISKGRVTALVPDLFHPWAERQLKTEREKIVCKGFFLSLLYYYSTIILSFFITVLSSTEIQSRACWYNTLYACKCHKNLVFEKLPTATVCLRTMQIKACSPANAVPRASELAALHDSVLTINCQCSNLRTSQNMALKLMDYGVRSG